MKKKIFRSTFTAIIMVVIVTTLLVMNGLYLYFTNIQKQQLEIETNLISTGIEQLGLDYLTDLQSHNYRITWIEKDGTILFDNYANLSEMENHLDREEIILAQENGYGFASRYSKTLMQTYLYGAKLLSDGSVVRLSIAQNSILQLTLGMSGTIIVIVCLAIGLSSLLAKRISNRVVEPINLIDLDHPYDNEGYDEIAPLLTRIAKQQSDIDNKRLLLERQAQESELVVTGMQEGLVLLNNECKVTQINPSAINIFNINKDILGHDFISICRDIEINSLIDTALKGKRCEAIVHINEIAFQCIVSPIFSHATLHGVMLLFIDQSEQEKLSQIRKEFTANVSHELKTPLQSISGRAELLANGLVKQEDIASFAQNIYQQAQNMNGLIEDIIGLSQLEEAKDTLNESMVDLNALSKDIFTNLNDLALTNHVKLVNHVESIQIKTVDHLLKQVLTNIIENAIKYNKENGEVLVTNLIKDSTVTIQVKDTGIGIDPKDQERIFERFYRVDKSRSRATGGSGLGLSIVKHACALINATIHIESELNVGTTVSITLPKN